MFSDADSTFRTATGDVSTCHASDVRTPNIDRLAAQGMLFTEMRANATVCSPSRGTVPAQRRQVGGPSTTKVGSGEPTSFWCAKAAPPLL